MAVPGSLSVWQLVAESQSSLQNFSGLHHLYLKYTGGRFLFSLRSSGNPFVLLTVSLEASDELGNYSFYLAASPTNQIWCD